MNAKIFVCITNRKLWTHPVSKPWGKCFIRLRRAPILLLPESVEETSRHNRAVTANLNHQTGTNLPVKSPGFISNKEHKKRDSQSFNFITRVYSVDMN